MILIKRNVIKSFVFSFRLVHAASRFYLWIGMLPALIMSILPLVTVYLIKLLIDATGEAMASPDKEVALRKVFILLLITALLFLVNYIAETFDEYIREVRSHKFFDFIYGHIHNKTAGIALSSFENDKYYDLFSRALSNAHGRPLNIVNSAITVLQNSISFITLGVLLFTLHYAIIVVLLVATIPLALVKLNYAKKLYSKYKENTITERKIWDVNTVLTMESFAADFRMAQLNRYFTSLFRALRKNVREAYLKIFKDKMLAVIAAQIVSVLAVFAALGIVSYQAVFGALTIGALTMYLMAIQKGVGLFNNIFHNLSQLYEDSLYVSYLERFLKMLETKDEKQAEQNFPPILKQGIEFRDVSFSYPESKRQALDKVNLFLPAGKTIALVGPNGAGKTTLVKLLCKLFEPDSGEILVDGGHMKEMSTVSVRNNMAVLFQKIPTYNFSAYDNISFGDKGHDKGADEIYEAARKAGIHDMITALPKGYETVLGKIFEDSEELSMGQWQRIGLARVFYKNCPVVILDEPTSFMDPDAEHKTFSNIKDKLAGKTVVLVSHRFSTVQMADYIYVLGNEGIAEHGTHSELLKAKGVYAEMYQKQAMYYST